MSEIISNEFLAVRLCFSPMLIPTLTGAERAKFCETCLRKMKQNILFVVPHHFTTIGDIIRTIIKYYYVPVGVDLTAEGFHLDDHLPVKLLKQISGPITVTPLRKMEAKFRCLGDGTCLDPGFTLQELADTSFDPPGTTSSLPASTTDDSGFEENENENNHAEDVTAEMLSNLTPESTVMPTGSPICRMKYEVGIDNGAQLSNGKRKRESDLQVDNVTVKKGKLGTAMSAIAGYIPFAGSLKRAFEAIAGTSQGTNEESPKRVKASKPLLHIKSLDPENYAKQLHWTKFSPEQEINTDAVLKLKIQTQDGTVEDKIVVVEKINGHCISGKGKSWSGEVHFKNSIKIVCVKLSKYVKVSESILVITNTGKAGEITVERSAIKEIRTWVKSENEGDGIGID